MSDILQRDLTGFQSDVGHLHRRSIRFHLPVAWTLFSDAWSMPQISLTVTFDCVLVEPRHTHKRVVVRV